MTFGGALRSHSREHVTKEAPKRVRAPTRPDYRGWEEGYYDRMGLSKRVVESVPMGPDRRCWEESSEDVTENSLRDKLWVVESANSTTHSLSPRPDRQCCEVSGHQGGCEWRVRGKTSHKIDSRVCSGVRTAIPWIEAKKISQVPFVIQTWPRSQKNTGEQL